jgi:hypothetical protein
MANYGAHAQKVANFIFLNFSHHCELKTLNIKLKLGTQAHLKTGREKSYWEQWLWQLYMHGLLF